MSEEPQIRDIKTMEHLMEFSNFSRTKRYLQPDFLQDDILIMIHRTGDISVIIVRISKIFYMYVTIKAIINIHYTARRGQYE